MKRQEKNLSRNGEWWRNLKQQTAVDIISSGERHFIGRQGDRFTQQRHTEKKTLARGEGNPVSSQELMFAESSYSELGLAI